MSDPLNSQQPDAPTAPTGVVPAETVKPGPPAKSATQKAQETAVNAYRIARMVVLIVLGFMIALFVVRNWNEVEFDYVFGDANLPLAVVMLLFTAIGIVVGMLVLWFLSRRTAKSKA